MPDQTADDTLTARPFDAGGVLAFAAGHWLHDTYAAFLFPLLPLLIDKLSLSLTMAGTLTLFYRLPSVTQPFIGYWADRVNLKILAILAPAVTATVMSLIGLAPNLGILILMITVAGISSAAFHAPSPAAVSYFSGRRLGLALSIYQMGGELGRTLGPLLIVAAVSLWTLEGTYWLIAPGLAGSAILYWRLKGVSLHATGAPKPNLSQTMREIGPMIIPLSLLLSSRGLMTSAVTTFLPTFMDSRGVPLWLAGASLSIVEGAGVLGVLAAGAISDRWGRQPTLLASFITAPIFLLLFVRVSGWLVFPILVLAGFTTIAITPVLLAFVLERHPQNRATATGVFSALSFVIGSVTNILLGWAGDQWGLQTAYLWSALGGFLGIPLVFLLPKRTTVEEPLRS
jgi:MFS transporter, FSR family, fosmidomycin resistance protein